ncbi:hypothetical protein JOD24_001179 [Kroppenstedtia sanguinis]|nr:formate acetyltransferase [Desmospora sp. 8437]
MFSIPIGEHFVAVPGEDEQLGDEFGGDLSPFCSGLLLQYPYWMRRGEKYGRGADP